MKTHPPFPEPELADDDLNGHELFDLDTDGHASGFVFSLGASFDELALDAH